MIFLSTYLIFFSVPLVPPSQHHKLCHPHQGYRKAIYKAAAGWTAGTLSSYKILVPNKYAVTQPKIQDFTIQNAMMSKDTLPTTVITLFRNKVCEFPGDINALCANVCKRYVFNVVQSYGDYRCYWRDQIDVLLIS